MTLRSCSPRIAAPDWPSNTLSCCSFALRTKSSAIAFKRAFSFIAFAKSASGSLAGAAAGFFPFEFAAGECSSFTDQARADFFVASTSPSPGTFSSAASALTASAESNAAASIAGSFFAVSEITGATTRSSLSSNPPLSIRVDSSERPAPLTARGQLESPARFAFCCSPREIHRPVPLAAPLRVPQSPTADHCVALSAENPELLKSPTQTQPEVSSLRQPEVLEQETIPLLPHRRSRARLPAHPRPPAEPAALVPDRALLWVGAIRWL